MFKIILFLALNITITSLYAQALPANAHGAGAGMNISDHLLIAEAKRLNGSEAPEPIDGTPYLEDDFQEGRIITTKGVFDAIPMRYNVEKDYVEFKQKGVTYILDPSPSVKKVSLPATHLVVDNYNIKGKATAGFYVLLDSGRLTLLMKKKVFLRPAQAPKAIETEGRPARYEAQGDEFFYKLNGGPISEIVSVKKMLEVLTDHQDEVKAFVSKEKISKKEPDLIKLVAYYNQL
ncbi:MAG TPA: hypothetical protein VIU12_11290 [Chryseolinea sp.]